jgi:hypothetical protein
LLESSIGAFLSAFKIAGRLAKDDCCLSNSLAFLRGATMDIPHQWRDYPCEDYFSSPLAIHGYWDGEAKLWVIETAQRVEEDPKAEFLQVGRPGVDSIGFGYRKRHPGLWAYHRMELRFQYLAETVVQLLDGWLSGRVEI